MNQPSRVSLVAAFAAVYLIWGSTYLAIRWGVAEIPPFLMAGGRFRIAKSPSETLAGGPAVDRSELPMQMARKVLLE